MRSEPRIALETVARYASDMRNAIRIRARAFMADRVAANNLEVSNPTRSTEYYIEKYKGEGLEGDALWEKVIEKALTTNPEVNEQYK